MFNQSFINVWLALLCGLFLCGGCVTTTHVPPSLLIPKIDDDNVESILAEDSGIVVVLFGASWAPHVRQIVPMLEELTDRYKGAVFQNVVGESVLSRKYNIVGIPTVIVFNNGREQARLGGTVDFEKWQHFVESALAKRGHTDIAVPRLLYRTWQLETIAVAELTANALSRSEAKTLTDRVHSVLVATDYFKVVSYSDMASVLEAQNFPRTGHCDDTACLVEMGRILAVQKIVGGAVGRVGATFVISLRFVDVETGRTEFTVDEEVRGDADNLLAQIQPAARRLAAEYARRKAEN